ncbi:MAG: 4-(cytidine 5'-diphospho)-2-C-methyl-D-erythritol kinase [Fimbriimonas sp.]
MLPLTVRCPAKVNLFLAVGPPDARGYHPLRTVFQAIGLYDTMEFGPGQGAHEVTFEGVDVPATNTVTRALRMLSEIVAIPPLRIHVRKGIPAESGLGGGSSDAAAVIRAVQRIARVTVPEGELAGIALSVGADVPFFLVGGRARAEGYGERLAPMPDAPREWLAIARPEVGCATGPAFARLDAMSYPWREFPTGDELYNDFERVAPCESLDLIERLQRHGARDAALSGSGSAVFGRFSEQADAERAAEALRRERVGSVWVAPTLTRAESLA